MLQFNWRRDSLSLPYAFHLLRTHWSVSLDNEAANSYGMYGRINKAQMSFSAPSAASDSAASACAACTPKGWKWINHWNKKVTIWLSPAFNYLDNGCSSRVRSNGGQGLPSGQSPLRRGLNRWLYRLHIVILSPCSNKQWLMMWNIDLHVHPYHCALASAVRLI